MNDMLFKTVHGSHLYGLAHKGSDDDFYVVVNTRRNRKVKYARQNISEGVDTTTVDFGTWMNMCASGVPQALEAMFSRMPTYEAVGIREFRNSFRWGDACSDRYWRTIDNFLAEKDFKKNRHGLRLAMNMRDGGRYGRFNPTLTPNDALLITYWSKNLELDQLRETAFGLAYDIIKV